MAIDTRAKRQSASAVGFPLPPSLYPTGTIGAFARQQTAWTYGGIAVAIPVSLSDFLHSFADPRTVQRKADSRTARRLAAERTVQRKVQPLI